jgi:molecular chaperone DnaJ
VKVRTCISLYISFPESSCISKDIEAINGKVRIKLEGEFNLVRFLDLRNIPNINGYASGDLLVHVNVWT